MLRGLLILTMMSCFSAERAPAVTTTASVSTMAAGSSFHEDFRTAYGSVLWTMMVLRWCNDRWNRPKETAAAEARFKAITARAIRRGLKRQMDQAAQDNARKMAVMRLDVRCNGGFARPHANAKQALTKVERLMLARRNP
jgi:hypothetical protein